jgi:hypothetical protein
MKKRSPVAVFLLGLITIGFYSWYWAVKTKGEMNKLGEKIPTAWIWLIPFVGGVWWYWKYSEGVEHVTHEKPSGVLAFILLFLLGNIGQAIIQDFFNKLDESTVSVPASPLTGQPVGAGTPSFSPQPSAFQPPASPIQGDNPGVVGGGQIAPSDPQPPTPTPPVVPPQDQPLV